MNIHPNDMQPMPDDAEAQKALATLRKWAASASNAQINDLDPAVARL